MPFASENRILLICIKSRGVVNYAKHGMKGLLELHHDESFTKFVPIGTEHALLKFANVLKVCTYLNFIPHV